MIPYIEGETDAFDAILSAIGDLHLLLAATVESAVATTTTPALTQLQSEPRPSVHPFRWSLNPQADARARRWYFAAIHRGEIPTDGERYRRSGRFTASYDAGVQETSDSVDAVLGNNFNKASIIAGSADGSIKQIPGHVRTGWQAFYPIAESWADDTVAQVRQELPGEIRKRF